MLHLLWDASALAKRYAPEIGSGTVNALFEMNPPPPFAATFLGYAETFSLLLRKWNRREITAPAFAEAHSALRLELLDSTDFTLLTVDDSAILNGIALIRRHSLNASDAAILCVFLQFARLQRSQGNSCAMVATDQRFLRAAIAEGLPVLDPERLAAADLPMLLSAL